MMPDEIKSWRLRMGYTQHGLARALGISQVTVARWETGRQRPEPYLRLALRCLDECPQESDPKEGSE